MENRICTWTYETAAACVTHSCLSSAAESGLRAAFAPVKELWLVLASGDATANGKSGTLDILVLIRDGQVTTEPLTSSRALPPGTPSLAAAAMVSNRVVTVLAGTPEADRMADCVDRVEFEEKGMTWILASPLNCKDPHCQRVLGAAIVAGVGDSGPGTNPEWLQEWSCELAHNIAHASIGVMESSLDMLRLLFPPKVVESLVLQISTPHSKELHWNAASTEALRLSLAQMGLDQPPQPHNNTLSTSTVSQGPRDSMGSPSRRSGRSPTSSSAALSPGWRSFSSNERSSAEWDVGNSARSPFALVAQEPRGSPTTHPVPGGATTRGRSPSWGSDQTPTEPQSIGRSSSLSTAAGNNNNGYLAAAVLRQVSLHSTSSLMLSEYSGSPKNSEFEGYEDLLEDDVKSHAARRPSQCLDRATCQDGATPSPGSKTPLPASLDEPISATDSDTITTTDVPPDYDHHDRRHCTFSPTAVKALSTISEGSSNQASGSISDIVTAGGAIPNASAIMSRVVSTERSVSSSGPWGQEWDLAFKDSRVEGSFSRHLAPQLSKVDRALGAILGITGLTWTAYMMAMIVIHNTLPIDRRSLLLSVALIGVVAMPGVVAVAWPGRWTTWRTTYLVLVRMTTAILLSVVLESSSVLITARRCGAVAGGVVPATRTAAQALNVALLAAIFPLPLRFHIPLQLFCVWVALETNILSFVLGFVLPTVLVSFVERAVRRQYMSSRL